LNSLANATLTITATVDAGTTDWTILNVANLNAVDQTDTNAANDTASVSITVWPFLSINDVTLTEGDSGTTDFIFSVTLSSSTSQVVTVNYATADDTATLADSDYVSNSGPLTFPAGTTVQTITVQVNGDTAVEPDETFFVNLSGASNATISDNQGVGTILNDDIACSSTITLTATGDTWIQNNNPTNNNDSSPVLQVRADTVTPTFRSLIQYNLSSIAPGTTVCSANLLLDELDTNLDLTIFVHRVTTSWSAATATWNSPWGTPGGDYFSPAATSFAPNTTGIRSIDITALGQYWVDNPGSNFGLILRSTTVGDNATVQFESLEGSPDPPRLVVQY
jgi:hypothetical protein